MAAMAEPGAPSSTRALAARSPSFTWLAAAAFICIVFVIRCAALLIEARNDLTGALQDDAFYYIIPAANLAHGLGSTFDGLSRTNGYHPLWLLICAGCSALGAPGIGAALGAGMVLDAIGLGLVFWLFRRQPAWFLLIAGGAYLYTTYAMAVLTGMETDAFAASFLALLAAIQVSSSRPVPLLLGVCASVCILARLDAALFVIPLVVAGAATGRHRAMAGTIVFVTLCVFAVVNMAWFGLALPVSGDVKSLGGLQINYPLLHELASRLERGGGLAGTAAHWVTEPFILYAVMLVISVTLFMTLRGRSHYVLAAFVVGLALYIAREVFLSSWRTWPWYFYPLFIGAMTILFVLASDRPWRTPEGRRWFAWAAMLPLAVLFVVEGYAGTGLRAWHALHGDGYGFAAGRFYRLNERAATIMNGIAPGARVAMGDRSGSFAYYYSGHVVQLEGLMNDAAYYRLLKQGGDAKALLCARGVQYVIAYAAEPGHADSVDVPVVRASLSDYPRYPVLHLLARDQVMKFGDPDLYTGSMNGDNDDTIYAWRLSGCKAAAPPAP
jgi:hypothetical protein